ncbi:MAG: hypothetical protein JSW46_15335 [Gemmatimonadota bacterium]|nr:MAG: hypothetical protein JSW46_15335 [Gemmatimonadota bacterium]
MMSDPTSVDKTTVDELTGKLVLVIEEARAWRETDLMHRQLAAKVKTYVRYARSPKFTADHGRPAQGTIVRIVTAEPPGAVSQGFFQRVAHELRKHGLVFEQQLGEDGFPEVVTPSADTTVPSQAPNTAPSARPTPPPAAGPPPPPAAPTPAAPEPGPPIAPPSPPPPPPEPRQPQQPVAAEPPFLETPPTPKAPPDPWAEEVPPEPAPPPDPWAEEPPAQPSPPPDPWAEEAPSAGPSEPAQPAGLEFEPTFPGAAGDLDAEPAASGEPDRLEFEPALPGGPNNLDADAVGPASELEQLIEGDEGGIEFIGASEEPAPAAAGRPPGPQAEGEATYPPFFPEEEFGRALPDVDEVAMGVDAEATTAVIETAAGRQIRLDSPSALDEAIATPIPAEQGPSLLRAVGAAFLGAIAGAIVWILLAIPAATGASPLALAVAVMVGFNVRLRGAGHTMPFRVVGILGTLFGSAIGSVGAAVALSAMEAGTKLAGVMEILSDQGAVLAAFTSRYGALDLFSLFLAGYLAFRISASKPS